MNDVHFSLHIKSYILLLLLGIYVACNDRNAFFTSDAVRNYNLWSCQKVCEALTFLLDNIHIRFGSKLYRQIVGIWVLTVPLL